MGYMALYRKLRPQRFGDVVGQEHIIRILQNQIKTNRVTHAYLFCGTRGTGKTSTAKIFAKAVNCESLEDGEPCGHCRVCQDIQTQVSMNVLEIDAASNNGVDNIRDIREEVKYPPTEGVYKVYIIDEVHMLSTGAFNALLKTLEEPPTHVIFILATTDPQKIPPTILSRCQRFDFRRISTDSMTAKMREYLAEENVEAQEEALQYIARISDGAMRDALSLLDQCLSFYFGQAVTLERVLELTGSVDDSVFYNLSLALNRFDSQACLSLIDDIVMKGRDITQFAGEFIGHLRNVLVASAMGSPDGEIGSGSSALDLSRDNINRLLELSGVIHRDRLISYINAFSLLYGRLKYASNPRIQMEVCCISLCNPEAAAGDEVAGGLAARLEKLEANLGALRSQEPAPVSAGSAEPKPEAPPVARPKAVPQDIRKVMESWGQFVENFTHMDRAMLSLASPQYLEGEEEQLCLVCGDVGSQSLLKQREEMVLEKLRSVYGKEFRLQMLSREEYNARHKNIYGSEDEEFQKQLKELNEKLQTEIIIDTE